MSKTFGVVDTYTEWNFVEAFERSSRQGSFTREALQIIFRDLESLAEACQEDIEFEPAVICGDYNEYSSIEDFVDDNGEGMPDMKTWCNNHFMEAIKESMVNTADRQTYIIDVLKNTACEPTTPVFTGDMMDLFESIGIHPDDERFILAKNSFVFHGGSLYDRLMCIPHVMRKMLRASDDCTDEFIIVDALDCADYPDHAISSQHPMNVPNAIYKSIGSEPNADELLREAWIDDLKFSWPDVWDRVVNSDDIDGVIVERTY